MRHVKLAERPKPTTPGGQPTQNDSSTDETWSTEAQSPEEEEDEVVYLGEGITLDANIEKLERQGK